MSSSSQIYPFPLGVYRCFCEGKSGIRVAFSSREDDCGVILFDRRTGRQMKKHPISEQNRLGNVRYTFIELDKPEKVSYLFYEGERIFADSRARAYASGAVYGKAKRNSDMKAVLPEESYDWEGDRFPGLSYNDSICYGMHIRGFTKHSSSGVKAKGTYAGAAEKLPYLKDLGVTTLELQPIYEFIECTAPELEEKGVEHRFHREPKLNYWGYQDGFYYAPKEAYAYTGDAVRELKDLVKALHKNGMELILQFYFPNTVKKTEISEILRYWRYTFHIDGFHLMGSEMPVEELAMDEALAGAKLWYYDFPLDRIYEPGQEVQQRTLASFKDDYMYHVRKLLKGDENMIYTVMRDMRCNPRNMGAINYLTNYSGLTMADLVSYDRKHNEGNGEDNHDGSDYNCSWNCGVEGPSRKKQIRSLRERQIKNAFFLLFFSQGTPFFFMGDEFGNSQKGNNNPYCQDNAMTWLNWNDQNKNQSIYTYVRELTALRKENAVFHMQKECMLMDYKSCGCPDLSYHGEEAWKPSWESYNRHIGIMLCGDYAPGCEGTYYYAAVNMHWEKHRFALPRLPKNSRWEICLCTDDKASPTAEEDRLEVGPRSIVLCCSTPVK